MYFTTTSTVCTFPRVFVVKVVQVLESSVRGGINLYSVSVVKVVLSHCFTVVPVLESCFMRGGICSVQDRITLIVLFEEGRRRSLFSSVLLCFCVTVFLCYCVLLCVTVLQGEEAVALMMTNNAEITSGGIKPHNR